MKYKVLIGGMIGVPITFLDKYNPDTGGVRTGRTC